MSDTNNIMKTVSKEQNKLSSIISIGFLVLFVVVSFINMEFVSKFVNIGFAFSIKYFGAIWQIFVSATFFIALALGFSKYGKVKLGGLDKPEFSTFRWVSMIMCTLLAGGGVFWSACEPMYYFLNVPPTYPGINASTAAAVAPALSQAFLHWGFYAWAMLGTLGTIVLMYSCHVKGMPLAPRSLIYPILGEKGVMGIWGTLVDATTIIATAAGTIGPIGFLGLQMSYALSEMTPISDVFTTQATVIAVVTVIFTLVAATPIYKGINHVSFANICLTLFVIAFILLFGPGMFVVDSFLSAMGLHLSGDFIRLVLYRGDTQWLGWWTVFFFAWFLGYAPMMCVFVTRVSRGRTIRELSVAVAVIAAIATNMWFSVLGGAGIFFELNNVGSISGPLNENGLPAALLSIIKQLPLTSLMIPVILLLVALYLITTGSGMAYSMAISTSGGDENPPVYLRVFWGVMMGIIAILLIKLGSGGIGALQNFIVVTAVPLTAYMVPTLWLGPKCATIMYKDQFEQNQNDDRQ